MRLSTCINCKQEFSGRLGQLFCSTSCRVSHWQKSNEGGGDVYALQDRRTGEVRYVGQTAGTIEGRLESHRKSRLNPALAEWLASSEVDTVILDSLTSWGELHRHEAFWIRRMRKAGHRLFNQTGIPRLPRWNRVKPFRV